MKLGLPEDAAGWIAIGLGVAAIAAAPRLARAARSRGLVALAAALAGALSATYVALYLRGGPRIVDATTYLLEARTIAHGRLAFPVAEPVASTLGRFLVHHDAPGGVVASGLFPPGWPAVLAIGVALGAPLAVGPVIAVALVLATHALATRAVRRLAPDPGPFAAAPAIAALLSAVCAALRYHTADTMSHGLAALCATVGLAASLDATDPAASPRRARAAALLVGLAGGWLAATRPVSAIALGAAVLAAASWGDRRAIGPRLGLGAIAALGALPGLALLVAHQAAATGALFGSSQLAYYAQADGPPGCFRFGFGAGIGCLGEHGDFVRKHLPDGYGLGAAVMTTLRRLKAHLVDVGNVEPLALLVPVGGAVALRAGAARALPALVIAQIALYSPFYFDGNYPGGGARMFADALPVEHVLVALGAVALAERLGARRSAGPAWRERAAFAVVGAALVGFGVRAGFDHASLRDRDGGRPMFQPALLEAAGATRGLVYVDTDHGHAIGLDPFSEAPAIVRLRGDALDRMAWEARGRPPAFRYTFRVEGEGTVAEASVTPFDPRSAPTDRIEGESLWPAASQHGAFAAPELAGPGASNGRRLVVRRAGPPEPDPRVVLRLPAPFLRARGIAPRLDGPGRAVLRADGATIATFPGPSSALVPADATRLELELHPEEGPPLTLDRVDLLAPDGRAAGGESR
jgi:hypothetical protein